MITLPMKFLNILLMAVVSLRKAKAFNANMFRHAGIGYKEDAALHGHLSQLEEQLQSLRMEAQRAKSKTFCISVFPD